MKIKKHVQANTPFMEGVQSRLRNIISRQKSVMIDSRPLKLAKACVKSKSEK